MMLHARFRQFSAFGALLLGLLCTSQAKAVLIAYEGFDYDVAGNLAAKNGGTGWGASNPWVLVTSSTSVNLQTTLDGTSLSSPAYAFPTTGGRINGSGGASPFRNVRNLPAPLPLAPNLSAGTDSVAVYMSFMLRKDVATDSGSTLELDLLRTTENQSTNGIMRFGISSQASPTDTTMSMFLGTTANTFMTAALNTTYVAVLKLVANEAGDDVVSALVYDPTETIPTTEPLTWDATYTITGADNDDIFDRIRVWSGQNATGAFDEIRIGTEWADVANVPEPSAFALLGLAICGLRFVGHGRRRNE